MRTEHNQGPQVGEYWLQKVSNTGFHPWKTILS
jgi:hypothetical protein